MLEALGLITSTAKNKTKQTIPKKMYTKKVNFKQMLKMLRKRLALKGN
jgi:hypothetical protein